MPIAQPARFPPIKFTAGPVIFPLAPAENAFQIPGMTGPMRQRLFAAVDVAIDNLELAQHPSWEDPNATWTYPVLSGTYRITGSGGEFMDGQWQGSKNLGEATRVYNDGENPPSTEIYGVHIVFAFSLAGAYMFPQSPAHEASSNITVHMMIGDRYVFYSSGLRNPRKWLNQPHAISGMENLWEPGLYGGVTCTLKKT